MFILFYWISPNLIHISSLEAMTLMVWKVYQNLGMGPYCMPHIKNTSSLLVLWHNGGISSKNQCFRVALFSENRARRGKIEKIRPLLICNMPPIPTTYYISPSGGISIFYIYIYKIVAKKVLCPSTPPRVLVPGSWNLDTNPAQFGRLHLRNGFGMDQLVQPYQEKKFELFRETL